MRSILLLAPFWLLLLGAGGCSSSSLEGTPTFDMGSPGDQGTVAGITGLPLNAVTVPVGGGQRALAIADLDQDNKPDVVATIPYTGQVAILWNAGTNERSVNLIAAPGTPYGMVLTDLNNDKAPDLAVTDPESGNLNVFYTSSPFSDRRQPFRAPQPVVYPIGPGASVVQTGLLNGDADPDLAVLNTKDGTVSVLLNLGAAGMYAFMDRNTRVFAGPAHFSLALLPGRLTSADDVLVTSASDDTVSILRNDGLGALPPVTQGDSLLTLRGPVFVNVATFQDVARPIVYVAASASNQVQLWNAYQGTVVPRQVLDVAPRPVAVAAADLNLDGNPDIVIVSSSRDELQILLSSPDGTYRPSTLDRVATGQAPAAVAIADLNGNYADG